MKDSDKSKDQLLSELKALRSRVGRLEAAASEGGPSRDRDEIIRELMDCSPVPMALIDKKENFLFVNRCFISTLGYTLGDLPDVDAWWPLAYPDEAYREKMRIRWLAASRRLTDGSHDDEPGRRAEVHCKDGTVKDVEIHGANLERDSLIVYLDISDKVSAQRKHRQLIGELEAAIEEVNRLSGLLPICAHCKKIRDSEQYWHQVEEYITEHSEAEFTHSICPDCARELYPGVFDQ